MPPLVLENVALLGTWLITNDGHSSQTCSRSVCGFNPRSHIEVFAMLRNVRVVHEPSQARRTANVSPSHQRCVHLPLHSCRDFCVLCATQDACNSPSKKRSSNKDDLKRAWLYAFSTCTEHKYVMPSCAKPQERSA